MSDKIKILVVEPMKPCEVLELPDTLDAMRQIVGGDIEAVTSLRDASAIVCNENGKLLDLPHNRPLLLSPVYAFTDRGGCWFCPNAKLPELHHLYDHHPDLWARMLELQAIPNKATEKFNRTQKFSDIDSMFRQEDGEVPLRQAA